MAPWHDCAPSHSRPDGAVVAGSTHRATHRPPNSHQLGPRGTLPAYRLSIPPPMAARPPSSCQCDCLTPPSSPSIGIRPGPVRLPLPIISSLYPSSLVSTTGTSHFGGFGLRRTFYLNYDTPVVRFTAALDTGLRPETKHLPRISPVRDTAHQSPLKTVRETMVASGRQTVSPSNWLSVNPGRIAGRQHTIRYFRQS